VFSVLKISILCLGNGHQVDTYREEGVAFGFPLLFRHEVFILTSCITQGLHLLLAPLHSLRRSHITTAELGDMSWISISLTILFEARS
jgi:hypothetical protein